MASCSLTFAGRDPITGQADIRCLSGGGKKRRSIKRNIMKRKTTKRKTTRRKSNSRKQKMSKKKLDRVIDALCSRMKRRCTPRYKKLLKKIVMKNI